MKDSMLEQVASLILIEYVNQRRSWRKPRRSHSLSASVAGRNLYLFRNPEPSFICVKSLTFINGLKYNLLTAEPLWLRRRDIT